MFVLATKAALELEQDQKSTRAAYSEVIRLMSSWGYLANEKLYTLWSKLHALSSML